MPPRPGPRACARADRAARRRDPARRHPRRLRLRPPRRASLGAPAARIAGAQLVQDLHPHDRGPKGTHDGAIIANGNLYCPATPRTLLELGPLARAATAEQAAAHDRKTAELARHKLGRITADDADGYHRVACPAAMGKIRCPLRPPSMTLDRDRPEILTPPENPQACCTQQTITVPPDVNAKTRQKHDYPSAAHRRSYARRTGAERGFATAKDPATNDITRGWCRLMGLAPLMLFTATLLIVRNQRILHAWNARQAENQRRAAAGLPPKTRKRRRKTLTRSPRHPAALTGNHRASRDQRPSPPPRQPHADQAKACPAYDKPGHPGPAARPENPTPDHGQPTGHRMSEANVKIGLTET